MSTEKQRQQMKAWRKKNKERFALLKSKWQRKNREKVHEMNNDNYHRHREERLAKAATRYRRKHGKTAV